MDWTRPEINELISLYRQYECLWNTSHEDYNNYDAKQTAWLEIANACGKGVDDIRRKVKNLRSAYVCEKKKSEAAKERGIKYRPNLFYYQDMDFLEPVLVLRRLTLPPSTPQSFFSSQKRDINTERKHKIVKIDRKSLRDTKFSNAIDSIVASVQQIHPMATRTIEDENDGNNVFISFGKTTALQLQQLPLDKATEAMAAIYQLVAKKTLDSLKKSQNEAKKRNNGIISFETMSLK